MRGLGIGLFGRSEMLTELHRIDRLIDLEIAYPSDHSGKRLKDLQEESRLELERLCSRATKQ